MVEETTFASGALRLEARLEQPAGAARAAVICHPHPLDSYCPPAAVATYAARLAPGSASRVLAGADHFFGGCEPAITAAVRDGLAGDPR